MRPVLLLVPACVPVALVLGAGLGTAALQALGLMPLVGAPTLTADAFTGQADDLARASLVSVWIAAASTLIAVVVGLAAGVAIASRGRVVAVLAALTVPVPHLIGAAAIGLLVADSGLLARLLGIEGAQWPQLVGGPWWIAVILEFAWKESAFVAIVVAGTLATRIEGYSDLAATLGAGRATRFRLVTLPLAAPALAAAAMITFVYSFGSVEVPLLLGRPYPEPLPVLAARVFSSIDLASRPDAAAAALVSSILSVTVLAIALVLARRSSLWR